MKVFIDTNILIDIIARRENFEFFDCYWAGQFETRSDHFVDVNKMI